MPKQVTIAVCAGLDEDTMEAVLRRVEALADAGLPVRTPPRHPPHVTLAGARVAVEDVPALLGVLRGVAAGAAPVPLHLDHLGIFPGAGAVWLGPTPVPALRALQHDVDAALRVAGWGRAFGQHSAPENWVPHCTLAVKLRGAQLAVAVEVLSRGFRPVVGAVVGLCALRVGGRGLQGNVLLGGGGEGPGEA